MRVSYAFSEGDPGETGNPVGSMWLWQPGRAPLRLSHWHVSVVPIPLSSDVRITVAWAGRRGLWGHTEDVWAFCDSPKGIDYHKARGGAGSFTKVGDTARHESRLTFRTSDPHLGFCEVPAEFRSALAAAPFDPTPLLMVADYMADEGRPEELFFRLLAAEVEANPWPEPAGILPDGSAAYRDPKSGLILPGSVIGEPGGANYAARTAR